MRALNATNVAKTLLINKTGVESMLDACANIDAAQIKEWLWSVMGEEKPVQENVPQVVEVHGVRGYLDKDGIAWLNVEDVARGLGFVQVRKERSVMGWDAGEEGVPTSGDTFPKSCDAGVEGVTTSGYTVPTSWDSQLVDKAR